MRNTKYLIKEAKANTNTTGNESITDDLCVRLLNRAQEFIQAYIYNQGIENRIFRGSDSFSLVAGQDTYPLPSDIYAQNSVNGLFYVEQNIYSPIKLISEKVRSQQAGFFLVNSDIVFSPMPTNPLDVMVSYTRKLPAIGRSFGKIQTVNANTSIVLEAGYTSLSDVYDDYFSVVDFNGNIIKHDLLINQTGATLSLSNTSGILVGMYVVPGKYATTHCQLPTELEASLIMALETMINARLSSTDIPASKVFGEDQLNQIASMFADNSGDIFTPPITEYSEWV